MMNENLILEQTMYYHPLLIQDRLPVMIAFDDNNRVSEVKDEVEPLRVKTSFTMRELYKRWAKATNAYSFNEKRDVTVLTLLNENLGLDLVLFAIDLAERACAEGRQVASPYRLEEFMLEASGILSRRVTAFRKAGYFN